MKAGWSHKATKLILPSFHVSIYVNLLNDYSRFILNDFVSSVSDLDSRLSVLVWLAMLVSFFIIVTFPRPSGIRTFVGSTILRLIFSLGLEPTLKILGLANVRNFAGITFISITQLVD